MALLICQKVYLSNGTKIINRLVEMNVSSQLKWIQRKEYGRFRVFGRHDSVILGLGITRLFGGIGEIIEHRRTVRPYWVHLLWR